MINRILAFSSQKKSRPYILLLAVFCICAVGYVDFVTGEEISLALFYLIPVTAATWFISRRAGFSLAGFAMALELGVHHIAQPNEIQTYQYLNAATNLFFFSFFVIVLAGLKRHYERAKHAAGTDPLTGVMNLRAFSKYCAVEIERSYRYTHPFSVAYMDIDNFKEVNDTYGHAVGDEVLKVAALTMQEFLRSMDVIARVGGDEFVFFLPETGDEAAGAVIKKIHDILTNVMKRNEWPVTYSIGAITFLNAPRDFDDMMKRTDNLMYEAKKEGKNRLKHEIFKAEW